MSCYTHSPIGLTKTSVLMLFFHSHFSLDFDNYHFTLFN